MDKSFDEELKLPKAVLCQINTAMVDLPGYVFYKDNQSKYLWCNNNFAKLVGYKTYLDIINKTDFDLNWDKVYLEECIIDDQKILCTGVPLSKEYQLYNKKRIAGSTFGLTKNPYILKKIQ